MELLQLMIYSSKLETIEFKVVFVIALVLSFCRNIALIEETKPWSIWRCLYNICCPCVCVSTVSYPRSKWVEDQAGQVSCN